MSPDLPSDATTLITLRGSSMAGWEKRRLKVAVDMIYRWERAGEERGRREKAGVG